MDELSQLDELIESDILEALGEDIPENKEENTNSSDDDNELEIDIQDFQEEETPSQNIDLDKDEDIVENLDAQNPSKIETSMNSNDLTSLLTQLLANKTIEITIKIKD